MMSPTVSIVDDDESVCRALSRLMKSVGFEVRTYTSAEDFLRQGGQDDASCLVLDVRMPGIGGLGLQEKLADSGCRIPIIFITAHEDERVRSQVIECGAVAFLQKPFEDQDLLDAIYSAMGDS